MTRVFRRGKGLPIGRFTWKNIKLLQTIAYEGPLHVNIVGPSGSGKSATLTTMLGSLAKKAAAFVVDCDGAMIRAVGGWLLETGHKLICLDPNRLVSGFTAGRWNALREFDAAVLRSGREAVINAAKALGEGLVKIENQLQPTFDNGGRDFLVSLCLYVWLLRDKKDLVEVRNLLCMGLPIEDPKEEPFDRLLFEMSALPDRYNDGEIDDGCGGRIFDLIARGAATMKSGQAKTGENPFRGAAMRATSWLDIITLASLCEDGDNSFTCGELKTSNACVFIVAPLTDIKSTYSGWVRSFTVMTAYAFQNMPGSLDVPTLMVLDEANSLGRLELIEVGSPGFRKYGIQLVTCFQDVPAISARNAYPDTWQSLISNAGVTLWMGAVDLETTRYISDLLGKFTATERIEGSHWLFRLLRISKIQARFQNVERQLLDPQKVKDLINSRRGMMIVTGKDGPFVIAIDPYWKALPVWRYKAEAHYGETLLRQFTRWFVPFANTWAVPVLNYLKAEERRFFMRLTGAMNEELVSLSIGMAVIAGCSYGLWEEWSTGYAWLGTSIKVVGGFVAVIGWCLFLVRLFYDAHHTASDYWAKRPLKHPWRRATTRFTQGLVLKWVNVLCLLWALEPAGVYVADHYSVLLSLPVYALTLFLWLVVAWLQFHLMLLLPYPVIYWATTVMIAPFVLLSRVSAFQTRLAFFCGLLVSGLDEQSPFARWANPRVDRWIERLAKRSGNDRQHHAGGGSGGDGS